MSLTKTAKTNENLYSSSNEALAKEFYTDSNPFRVEKN